MPFFLRAGVIQLASSSSPTSKATPPAVLVDAMNVELSRVKPSVRRATFAPESEWVPGLMFSDPNPVGLLRVSSFGDSVSLSMVSSDRRSLTRSGSSYDVVSSSRARAPARRRRAHLALVGSKRIAGTVWEDLRVTVVRVIVVVRVVVVQVRAFALVQSRLGFEVEFNAADAALRVRRGRVNGQRSAAIERASRWALSSETSLPRGPAPSSERG